jgi:hypothetical protein
MCGQRWSNGFRMTRGEATCLLTQATIVDVIAIKFAASGINLITKPRAWRANRPNRTNFYAI